MPEPIPFFLPIIQDSKSLQFLECPGCPQVGAELTALLADLHEYQPTAIIIASDQEEPSQLPSGPLIVRSAWFMCQNLFPRDGLVNMTTSFPAVEVLPDGRRIETSFANNPHNPVACPALK